MADVSLNFSEARIYKKGTRPYISGTVSGEPTEPVNPEGTQSVSSHNSLTGIMGSSEGYHVSKDQQEGIAASPTSITALNPAASQADLVVAQRSTNEISWDVDANYGTASAPRTGALTETNTGAKLGKVAKIFYQNSSLNVPSTWNFGRSVDMFEAGFTCVIYVEYDENGFKTGNILDLGLSDSFSVSTLTDSVAISNATVLVGPAATALTTTVTLETATVSTV